MSFLPLKDIESLNHVIADIYTARDPEEFFRVILVILKDILSYDLSSYNEYDNNSCLKKAVHGSSDHDHVFRKHEAAIKSYLPTHPGFSVPRLQCTILSDLIKPAAFKKTELYNEYYRHLDVQSQMLTELSPPGGIRSILSFSRGKPDFNKRDRFILSLIEPHVINAYRNCIELHHYREKIALLEKGRDFPELRTLGLTDREATILEWAAMGKTNRDIADILGISKRTVEKHLERIYEKLGVETKISAVSVIANTPAMPISTQKAEDL